MTNSQINFSIEDHESIEQTHLKIVDLPFQKFMQDDLAAVKNIYHIAGLANDEQSMLPLRDYLEQNPRGKHGRFQYHLERDFGVDVSKLQARFSFYYDAFL